MRARQRAGLGLACFLLSSRLVRRSLSLNRVIGLLAGLTCVGCGPDAGFGSPAETDTVETSGDPGDPTDDAAETAREPADAQEWCYVERRLDDVEGHRDMVLTNDAGTPALWTFSADAGDGDAAIAIERWVLDPSESPVLDVDVVAPDGRLPGFMAFDIDGDEVLDVVFDRRSSGETVWLSGADMIAGQPTERAFERAGQVVGDINGDGINDMHNFTQSLLAGRGDGSFDLLDTYELDAPAFEGGGIEARIIPGSERLLLVEWPADDGDVRLRTLEVRDGNIELRSIGDFGRYTDVVGEDIDGNLIAVTWTPEGTSIQRLHFHENSAGIRRLESGLFFALIRDLDGDGIAELITEGSGAVRRWESGFDAKYGPEVPLDGELVFGDYATGSVDLDGDGWHEFVAAPDDGSAPVLWTIVPCE